MNKLTIAYVALLTVFMPVQAFAQSAVLGASEGSVKGASDAADTVSLWSKIWPYLLAALIVGVVSFIFFVIARRRRKEEN